MHKEDVGYQDQAMSQLTQEQQDFILNTMRRGKKTTWLNIMAEMKGIVIHPADDEETIARKIGGWILEHFDDLGTREGKCECGQSLRYVYHVTHSETKDSLELGSTCIENYTGLDAKTVEAVIKGMKAIDRERDEILRKVFDGWRLPFDIPEDLQLPSDIEQHLYHQLPLLERQEHRLRKIISNHQREKWIRPTQDRSGTNRKYAEAFDLFSFADETAASAADIVMPSLSSDKRTGSQGKSTPNDYDIPEAWKTVVNDMLDQFKSAGQQHVTSLMMANHIAKVFGHDQDRYITGKPRTYYVIALYMDSHHALEVIDASLENITYKIRF